MLSYEKFSMIDKEEGLSYIEIIHMTALFLVIIIYNSSPFCDIFICLCSLCLYMA